MITTRICRNNCQLSIISRYLSTEVPTDDEKKSKEPVKPFSSIPGPKPLPIIGTAWHYLPYIGTYDASNLETFKQLNRQYGDMVKLEMPRFNTVLLFEPKLISEVFMMSGTIPKRPGLEALYEYRRSRPDVYANTGLLVEQGAVWKELRSKVQVHMMRPDSVKTYAEPMSIVASDFIERIKRHRKPNMEVDDFMNEVMKWGLESVGLVTLSRRLGCLADGLTKESEPQKIIDSVLLSFKALHQLELDLGFWALFSTPSYRALVKGQSYFESVIMKYLHDAIKNIQENPEDTKNMLNAILKDTNMDLHRVTGVMMDSFLAGIDTTSIAAAFLIYELARNPDIQERVYNEVCEVVPEKTGTVTGEQVTKLKLLRACMKETMRMHPPTIGTARTFDRDIELNGYHIPAKTRLGQVLVASCESEKYFPNSNKFVPERWIREGGRTMPTQFANEPFGYGTRKCIGFRIAEQEVHILVAKILQNFRLEYHGKPVGQYMGIVLQPDKPFEIKFYSRDDKNIIKKYMLNF